MGKEELFKVMIKRTPNPTLKTGLSWLSPRETSNVHRRIFVLPLDR